MHTSCSAIRGTSRSKTLTEPTTEIQLVARTPFPHSMTINTSHDIENNVRVTQHEHILIESIASTIYSGIRKQRTYRCAVWRSTLAHTGGEPIIIRTLSTGSRGIALATHSRLGRRDRSTATAAQINVSPTGTGASDTTTTALWTPADHEDKLNDTTRYGEVRYAYRLCCVVVLLCCVVLCCVVLCCVVLCCVVLCCVVLCCVVLCCVVLCCVVLCCVVLCCVVLCCVV